MSTQEKKLEKIGITLTNATKLPSRLQLPLSCVNQVRDRLLISGQSGNSANSSITGPFCTLEADNTTEEGYAVKKNFKPQIALRPRSKLITPSFLDAGASYGSSSDCSAGWATRCSSMHLVDDSP